jgi:hypothetical protein
VPVVYRGPYEYSSPDVPEDFLPQSRKLPGDKEPSVMPPGLNHLTEHR